MTPIEYIAAFPRPKRKAERLRLARAAGVTLATMRGYTEASKDGHPRRYCQNPEACVKLEKATRGMVSVAEWNPRYAPLTTPTV